MLKPKPTINYILRDLDDDKNVAQFENYESLKSYCLYDNDIFYQTAFCAFIRNLERSYSPDRMEEMFQDYFLDNLEDFIDEANWQLIKVVRG